MRFDLLLDMVHHRHGSNQNDGRNYLMRVKTGVEETPRDANCSKRLHHFKVAGRGSACQAQTFKVDEQGNTARDRSEQKQCDDGGRWM